MITKGNITRVSWDLGKQDGIYHFVFKSNFNKCKEDRSVPLPILHITWVDMCTEGVLLPGHILHTFLWSPVSPEHSVFDLVASFASALHLHCECLTTLLKALANCHPNHDVWLASYNEEKRGLECLNTYWKITLGEYWALREKGTPCAIPTMCVLTINKDKNLLLLWIKASIVILGNHEDWIWFKSDKFSLIFCRDSFWFLVSLIIQQRQALHQGDAIMPFVRVISLWRKSLLYIHLLATLLQIPRSIGFFWKLFLAYVRVPKTGTMR